MRNEAGLGIELHEFELTIGTKIFVAQTTSNLVVAIDATDHAKLLKQLGALRKGIKRTRRQTAGHHEIACAFRRGRNEHRSFDFDETLIVHCPPKRSVDLGADAEIALHSLGAKIDIAMCKSNHFVDLNAIVQLERRWFGHIQDFNAAVADFNRASWHVVVRGAIRTLTNSARDANHILRAKVGGAVDHALHETGVVTKVDEGQMLAVLAAAGHPATDRNLATDVGGSKRSAMVGAHRNGISHRWPFGFRRVGRRVRQRQSSDRPLLDRYRRAGHGSLRCQQLLRRRQ